DEGGSMLAINRKQSSAPWNVFEHRLKDSDARRLRLANIHSLYEFYHAPLRRIVQIGLSKQGLLEWMRLNRSRTPEGLFDLLTRAVDHPSSSMESNVLRELQRISIEGS